MQLWHRVFETLDLREVFCIALGICAQFHRLGFSTNTGIDSVFDWPYMYIILQSIPLSLSDGEDGESHCWCATRYAFELIVDFGVDQHAERLTQAERDNKSKPWAKPNR